MSKTMVGSIQALSLAFPAVLIILLYAVGAHLGLSLLKPRTWRYRRSHAEYRKHIGSGISDPTQQLRYVMAASFTKQPLMSHTEYSLFRIIEKETMTMRMGHRVFAQTSLGEILKSPDQDAFRSINSKRVDILIVDKFGLPVVAVEYQGAGHYQSTAAARDAVKKEALRRAGIRYLEFLETDTAELVRYRVRECLDWKAPSEQPVLNIKLASKR